MISFWILKCYLKFIFTFGFEELPPIAYYYVRINYMMMAMEIRDEIGARTCANELLGEWSGRWG
jgi:hypothetical protein